MVSLSKISSKHVGSNSDWLLLCHVWLTSLLQQRCLMPRDLRKLGAALQNPCPTPLLDASTIFSHPALPSPENVKPFEQHITHYSTQIKTSTFKLCRVFSPSWIPESFPTAMQTNSYDFCLSMCCTLQFFNVHAI